MFTIEQSFVARKDTLFKIQAKDETKIFKFNFQILNSIFEFFNIH